MECSVRGTAYESGSRPAGRTSVTKDFEKLEKKQVTLDVVVVDSADKAPVENRPLLSADRVTASANNRVFPDMNLTRLFFALATVSLALHAQAPQATPAQSRLLCLYFDLDSMDAAAQSTALENATKFVQEQAAPAGRITVMTYTSQLNVLQDFTADHETVLATLRSIVPSATAATGTPGADFNIFTADRQLAALQDAVELLAPLPEKKAMIYFSSGVPRVGVDNQAQLRATTNAAVRANVAIYSVDARGFVATPPR